MVFLDDGSLVLICFEGTHLQGKVEAVSFVDPIVIVLKQGPYFLLFRATFKTLVFV